MCEVPKQDERDHKKIKRTPHGPSQWSINQSSRVRSTTSPAALPTTIGEGDLSSRLTDELGRPSVKEFSSAYTHEPRQKRPAEKHIDVPTDLKLSNSLRAGGAGHRCFVLDCGSCMALSRGTGQCILPGALPFVDPGTLAGPNGYILSWDYSLSH